MAGGAVGRPYRPNHRKAHPKGASADQRSARAERHAKVQRRRLRRRPLPWSYLPRRAGASMRDASQAHKNDPGGTHAHCNVGSGRRAPALPARRRGSDLGRHGQDRHPQRPVGRLCRFRRQVVLRGRAHGGRGFRRQGAERAVEVITADHQNKPDVASNLARQWYDTDKVDAIMELTTSSVALAVQQLGKEKKKINIVTGAATTDLTGKACTPYGFHWAYDNRALAVGTGGALVEKGGDTWFFITADYAFGHSLEAETGRYVTSKGGKVVGAVRHPLSAPDFSSFLLQAQASKAKVVGLANAGLDTSNAIKQAAEFGIVQGGQRLAALLFTLAEVHGLGLQASQGLVLTEGYYWDLDDQTRAFAKRFQERTGRMPNMVQAGTYSAVTQYLKAIQAAGTDETEAVAKKLHEMPVEDFFAKKGKAAERPHDPRYVPVRGQEALRVEWAVGLLQAPLDH